MRNFVEKIRVRWIVLVLVLSIGLNPNMISFATNQDVDWLAVAEALANAVMDQLGWDTSVDQLTADLGEWATETYESLDIPGWIEGAAVAGALAGAVETGSSLSYTWEGVGGTGWDLTVGLNGGGWDGSGSPTYGIQIGTDW